MSSPETDDFSKDYDNSESEEDFSDNGGSEEELSENENIVNEEEGGSINEDESDLENEEMLKKNSESISEENNSDNERENICGELKTMSFEELMKLKQKLGSKVYNEAIFGTIKEKHNIKKFFKRENSNRPTEMSSKKQVPFGVGPKKKTEEVIADPRFNANCGDFDSSKFKKQYDFVNDMRETELKTLKMNLKKCGDPEETTQIKFLIQRLKNQLHEEKRRKEKLAERYKRTEEAKAIEHKKPFYVKSNLKNTEEIVKQFEELKQSGKLQKHLEKRRKKSLIRDRKKFNFH